MIRYFFGATLAVLGLGGCASIDDGSAAAEAKKELVQAERAWSQQLGILQLQQVRLAAENERLAGALDTAKKQLDEAVLEVVRSKAKLGSLGNRAEAASALAEGESLAKTVRLRSQAMTHDPDFLAADRMLSLGNREFQGQNYGGAYYLASTARTALAVLAARSDSTVEAATGEHAEQRFVYPVDLVIDSRGNVREMPRVDSRILKTLDGGTVVRAHAARDLWIRVELAGGVRGWIYHDLFRSN